MSFRRWESFGADDRVRSFIHRPGWRADFTLSSTAHSAQRTV